MSVDDVVGEMVAKLKALGVDSNTVIILMGDYGFIYDAFLAGQIKQTKPEEIALNIDIAPTILSLAGVPVPDSMQGVNLIDLLTHRIPDRKDFFYQHYFYGSPRIPQEEGVVTKRFKYMKFTEHDYEELYDIKYDPHETTNLAKDPKYRMELLKLRRRYKQLKRLAK